MSRHSRNPVKFPEKLIKGIPPSNALMVCVKNGKPFSYRILDRCGRGHLSYRLVSNHRCATCASDDVKERRKKSLNVIDGEITSYWLDGTPLHYNTGKPCANGHISDRRITDRVCLKCESDRKNRYISTERGKYLKHVSSNLSEKARERKRRWLKTPKGVARIQKSNKLPSTINSIKEWRKTENGKIRNRQYSKNRKAKYRLRSSEFFPITALSLKEIFSKFDNKCAYCLSDKRLTQDHIVSLRDGGAHVVSNIVPACMSCNCRKSAKNVLDWYSVQNFFEEGRWEKIKEHAGL